MKQFISTLILCCAISLGFSQKIVIDPALSLDAAGAPQLKNTEGFHAGLPAYTLKYLSYDPKLISLISFTRVDGKYEEKVSIIIRGKSQNSFSIQYILYNKDNPNGSWLKASKAKLTLNKPYTLGANIIGELSFSFTGKIYNSSGQIEDISGTVAGKFTGTVTEK